jgi:hypothetical protein
MTFDVQALLNKSLAEPRPYQQRIITKVVTGFAEEGLRSIMIDSPTGSGKSIMALLACKAMQELYGASVGWVSMRRNLLAQAARENEIKGFNVKMHMISMFDKNPPTGLDMLVIDEAQHDAAGSMGHIHAKVKPKWSLGMTATPFRADRIKLCFDKVIKDAGIHRLIQDGYLSPYHHYTIPDWKPDTVVEFFLRERDRWGKSLIYFHTLKACWYVWQLLCEAGVRCDVVTGNERKCAQLIEGFHDNKLDALINCAKLTEGFDCLSTDTEVLTKDGWRNVVAVSEGESCYSLNRLTGLMELTPVLSSAGRRVRNGERMFTLTSQHLNLRTTEGHEFHVKYRDSHKTGGREERLSDNWLTLTGTDLSARRSEFQLPLAAHLDGGFPGVNLTDDEIRFVGWYLTDGSRSDNDITISQSANPAKHAVRIRGLLDRLGLDYRERLCAQSASAFATEYRCYEFAVPKGNSKAQPRPGWQSYAAFLDKKMTPAFYAMTREQFLVLYHEMLLGNGSRGDGNSSGWVWTPHKEQADTICAMAVIRGLASSVSSALTKRGTVVYRVTVRDKRWIGIHPTDQRSAAIELVQPTADEHVWCLRNRNGTLVVRRNGKAAIIGNCPDLRTVFARPSIKSVTIQMGGRVFRKYPDIKFKQIVQSLDTKWPFPRTAGAALMHVHVDGGWRTLQPNDQVEDVARKARLAMATSTAELPKFITERTKKSRLNFRRDKETGRRIVEAEGNETPSSGVVDIPDNEELQTAGRPERPGRFRSAFGD